MCLNRQILSPPQDLTGRLQTSANRVLTAVDWPPAAAQQRLGSADEATAGGGAGAAADGGTAAADPQAGIPAETSQQLAPAAGHRAGAATPGARAGAASEAGSGGEVQERLARWTRQLSVFRFAVQDWTERLWQVRNIQMSSSPCSLWMNCQWW